MATVRIGTAAPDYFSGFLFNDTTMISSTSRRIVLSNDASSETAQRMVLSGTDFSYQYGHPTDGTVTMLAVHDSSGHVLATYSGLSLSLPRFLTTLSVAGSYDATGLLLTGNDRVIGSAGADDLDGGAGNDVISGGAGADFISDNVGRDTLDGGAGYDEISFSNDIYDGWRKVGGVTLDAIAHTATDPWGDKNVIRSFESFTGSYQADVLKGTNATAYTEIYRGLLGNDTIDGRGGQDRVEYDRDSYYGGKLGVVVDLATGRAIDGYGSIDRLFSIEQVGGTSNGDRLLGNASANQLYGHDGADWLDGRGGKDMLTGGAGADTLVGGAGKDTFAYNSISEGGDLITDFVSADDTISVASSGFGSSLATGTLDKTLLVVGADVGPTLATGQFLYDTSTGVLSWDADGTGSGSAVTVARLSGIPSIFNGDITVY